MEITFFGNENKFHFREGENRPNTEKILKSLIEIGLLKLNFNLSEWRSYTDDIIQQLRKYNSEILEDKYLDKPIDFSFELTSKLSARIDDISFDKIIDTLTNNGVNGEDKIIKKIFRYNSLIEKLKKILSDSIYKNIHLSDANISVSEEWWILDLYKKIYDLYRKIEKLNEYFNNDFKEYERFGIMKYGDGFSYDFNKINSAKDIYGKLSELQKIINDKSKNNINNRNSLNNPDRFLYEVYRILDFKNRNPDNLRNIDLVLEFKNSVEYINLLLLDIDFEMFQKKLTSLEVENDVKFSLNLSEFIPAFISRIDIIEIPETNKNNFISAFEKRKKKKDRLSLGYLSLSILLFLFVILKNYEIYLHNFTNNFTINEFITNFLGHNIYLFSIEILLLILAFYFLGLFKTYSKVVELYDSHILLIESDFYYRDDKDLNNSGSSTFELRKENTQKIHSLPDRSFEMLNGKHEIKTELPTSKLLDKLGDLLEKILSGLKKD